jgi:putative nucleotidyltransferase with HDIG domain
MSGRLATPPAEEVQKQIDSVLAERIANGKLDLPLLPQIAAQVVGLTSDSNSDASKLATLIHQDQALAARVLRIANSPAYMPRTPIVSLQQAVARLGMALLGEIALIASIRGGGMEVPGYETEIHDLWRHAFASGAFAKEIARLRRLNVESAFLCGLLHEIGKPVVLKAAVQIVRESGFDWGPSVLAALVDRHHARVGTLIAAKWDLPEQVCEAIAYYAEPSSAPSASREATITSLADHLATHLLWPDRLDESTLRGLPVVASLNLYPNDMDALLAAREGILKMVEAMSL